MHSVNCRLSKTFRAHLFGVKRVSQLHVFTLSSVPIRKPFQNCMMLSTPYSAAPGYWNCACGVYSACARVSYFFCLCKSYDSSCLSRRGRFWRMLTCVSGRNSRGLSKGTPCCLLGNFATGAAIFVAWIDFCCISIGKLIQAQVQRSSHRPRCVVDDISSYDGCRGPRTARLRRRLSAKIHYWIISTRFA